MKKPAPGFGDGLFCFAFSPYGRNAARYVQVPRGHLADTFYPAVFMIRDPLFADLSLPDTDEFADELSVAVSVVLVVFPVVFPLRMLMSPHSSQPSSATSLP